MPFKTWLWVAAIAATSAGGFAVWIVSHLRSTAVEEASSAGASQQVADDPLAAATVILTPAQIAALQIGVGKAESSTWQTQRTVVGRLEYDQQRYVPVKSACDGIVTAILLQPGEAVQEGQTVATISCPAVGSARSRVTQCLAELELAKSKQQWHAQICHGVESLVQLIEAQSAPEEISQALAEDSLGEFREKLVSAYTRARLGKQAVDSTRDASQQGAIAVSLLRQREAEMQSAAAALDAALEQSLFDGRQQCAAATAALAQAEREVAVSLQEINALLGPAAQPLTARDFDRPVSPELLSQVNLISPLAGTLEERSVTVGDRVTAGQTVFSVADVSHLWAVAEIRESDWDTIADRIGQTVEISSPALSGERFVGTVKIVGRRVDPTTGAAPLIAQLKNSDSRLRPGLFIRMTIPVSSPRNVLVVPASAVVVHEGQHSVFVAENEHTFRRTDVVVGGTHMGKTEIVSGLSPEQPVAVSGVFQLKSEWLLAGEEE